MRSFSNTSVVYDTALTYQWNTGSTQPYINVSPSQTTTYTVTGTTEFGCSNTAEQTIIVGTGTPQTIYDTVCQGAGYEANGFTLTAAETGATGTLVRSRTLTTSGCSSTLTLRLTVTPTVASTSSATACGSYIWNGVTYYESGDYPQTFTASNGCDSVVTLHLTLTDPPQVSVTATDDTICAGEEVVLHAGLEGPSTPVYHVPAVAIGDILCTDNSIVKPSAWPVAGKTAMGVVYYVDNTGAHGWAVHLQEQSASIQWGGYGTDISTLMNYTSLLDAIMDLDGYSNTQKIRNAGNSTTYPAAWTVDFVNGWYIPAVGQLRLLVSDIVTVNNSLQIVGGVEFLMNTSWLYWSSTEYGQIGAWMVHCTGSVLTNGKGNYVRLRSVRSF